MNELILLEDLGMFFPTEKSNKKTRYGLYKCHCGKEFKAQTRNIKNSGTKSCGCLKRYTPSKNRNYHNMSNHRLYKTWRGMIGRCYDTKHKAYSYYGGRGIKVCDRWLDVKNFIEDMYLYFVDGLTLDRINVNGNYEKSNCRWATKTIQSRNTRKIRVNNTSGFRGVTFNDRAKKWSARISINSKLIYIGVYDNKIKAAKAYDQYIIDNNLEHTLNFK